MKIDDIHQALIDRKEREQALNPTQSFIVQAPAGSGKTELLVRRFLKLLACVEKPEHILALTFTRKAAAEMRERIIRALQSSDMSSNPELKSLVCNALAHAKEKNWSIEFLSNQLQILTIDAFCAQLVRSSGNLFFQRGLAKRASNPSQLYQAAIEALFNESETDHHVQKHLRTLLMHLDNRWDILMQLLSTMLSQRDQWLSVVMTARQHEAIRKLLEDALLRVNQDAINDLNAELTALGELDELVALAQFASQHVDEQHALSFWKNNCELSSDIKYKHYWQALAHLCLTQTLDLRKMVDKRLGFPAESNVREEKKYFKEQKIKIQALLSRFSEHKTVLTLLQRVATLPPVYYTDSQWDVLEALFFILHHAYAHLRVVFSEQGQSDYVEVLLATLEALGSVDSPTDIALMLDHHIQHILVDEFQDTSDSQWQLLTHLTQGWMPDDHRSVFLVGDPMQSIYRFRQADVNLFLKAWMNGLPNIPLKPLQLHCNFRSQTGLVEWFNQSFDMVFPSKPDLNLGAVPYCASKGLHAEEERHVIPCFEHASRIDEASAMLDVIQNEIHQGVKRIAILVRARQHASDIVSLLKRKNIAYSGVDLIPLREQQHIQDLVMLTRALKNDQDRIAWLALLRMPGCGLFLPDVLIIAEQSNQTSIREAIVNHESCKQLSEDAQKRVSLLARVMHYAFQQQYSESFVQVIRNAWIHLGALNYLSKQQQEDCQLFFDALHELETEYTTWNEQDVNRVVDGLFSSSSATDNVYVSVMTIHRAKGLEFDVVLLPGLDRADRHSDAALLLWMERQYAQGTDLLMAPIKSRYEASEPIYHYLNQLEVARTLEERKRLLYVAATRAKSRLYLFACASKKIPSNSFLDWLLQANPDWHVDTDAEPIHPEINITKQKLLQRRFVENFSDPVLPEIKFQAWQNDDEEAALIGTAIHKLLYDIVTQGLSANTMTDLMQRENQYKHYLYQLGISDQRISAVYAKVMDTIENIINDETGRWILSNHSISKAEFSLSFCMHNTIKHIVLDRVFVDNHQLWIIDYKTAVPRSNESIEEFVYQQKIIYEEQLSAYAIAGEYFFKKKPNVALYFTCLDSPLLVDCGASIDLGA